MDTRAGETTLKFMLGAAFGFGIGFGIFRSVAASPLILATIWTLTTVLGGFGGVRFFNVSGKLPARRADEPELRPGDEVKRVIVYTVVGAAFALWLTLS